MHSWRAITKYENMVNCEQKAFWIPSLLSNRPSFNTLPPQLGCWNSSVLLLGMHKVQARVIKFCFKMQNPPLTTVLNDVATQYALTFHYSQYIYSEHEESLQIPYAPEDTLVPCPFPT